VAKQNTSSSEGAKSTPALSRSSGRIAWMATAARVVRGRSKPGACDSQLDAYLAELLSIDHVVEQLMASRRVADVAQVFADTLVERSGADCVQVLMAEPGTAEVSPKATATSGDCWDSIDLWCDGRGLAARSWQSASPVFIDDAASHDLENNWPQDTQLCAMPVRLGDDVVGVIVLISQSVDLANELASLNRITKLAAIAIGNARATEQLEHSLHRTRVIATTHETLASLSDSMASRQVVCQALFDTLNISHASVHRIDESGQAADCGVWEQSDDGVVTACEAVPEVVIKAREIVVSCWADRAQGSIATDLIHTAAEVPHRDQGYRQACAMPVYGVHGLTGVLVIANRHRGLLLDDGESHMVRSLAGQLSTTLDRQALSAELAHQAFHDTLTGLPNRRYFERELERLLLNTRKDESMLGSHVLFVDFDGFKVINDTHGHAAGDRLLQLAAHRLTEHLDPGSVLARMGGDEFALITLPTADVSALAERVIAAMDTPFKVHEKTLNMSVSVGVSRWPDDGNTADELLRHADYAMYEAKQNLGSTVVNFTAAYATRRNQRTQIEQDLRKGLDSDEFKLVYQPQFHLNDDRPVGVEALVRWLHPERGLVSPAEFIPIAEELGYIEAIGTRVLDLALAQVSAWQGTNLGSLRMSVNIAAPQFQCEKFVDDVSAALTRHRVAPALLELEVTESVVMRDIDSVAQRLSELRETGIRIAIDDFGTGYSSLSYLQDLPLDVLKIDRMFISRLPDENADASVVRTILGLAEALNLETVAEGVETIAQCDIIRRMGCDLVQGYLYSPPVAADALGSVLESLKEQPATRSVDRAA
jgi:diguanylate cyclase (GGDEF)-like protein